MLETATGAPIGTAQAADVPVRTMAFDPRRPLLLTGAVDEQGFVVWRVDGPPRDKRSGPAPELHAEARVGLAETWARSMQFAPVHPDRETTLVVLDNDFSVRLYVPSDGPQRFALRGIGTATNRCNAVAFAPDGLRIVLGCGAESLQVFDLRGRRLSTMRGVVGPVVDWSPKGDLLVSAGQNHTAQLWRAQDPFFRVEHLPRSVSRLAAVGARVVAGLGDGSIAVLDRGRRPEIARGTVQVPKASFALRSDGQRLVVGGNFGRMDLWDLSGDQPVREPGPAPTFFVRRGLAGSCFQFRADGALWMAIPPILRLLHPDGRIEEVCDLPGYSSVVCIGDRTAAIGQDFALWDCRRQVVDSAGQLPFGRGAPYPVVSGDRRTLVLTETGAGRGRLKFVDLPGRRVLRELDLGPATDPALSADGARILIPARNGQAKLWDLTFDPPRLITEFRGHTGTVWAACFHPDGRQLITAGADGTVRFWPTRFDGLERMVDERLVRDWTAAERARYGALLGR